MSGPRNTAKANAKHINFHFLKATFQKYLQRKDLTRNLNDSVVNYKQMSPPPPPSPELRQVGKESERQRVTERHTHRIRDRDSERERERLIETRGERERDGTERDTETEKEKERLTEREWWHSIELWRPFTRPHMKTYTTDSFTIRLACTQTAPATLVQQSHWALTYMLGATGSRNQGAGWCHPALCLRHSSPLSHLRRESVTRQWTCNVTKCEQGQDQQTLWCHAALSPFHSSPFQRESVTRQWTCNATKCGQGQGQWLMRWKPAISLLHTSSLSTRTCHMARPMWCHQLTLTQPENLHCQYNFLLRTRQAHQESSLWEPFVTFMSHTQNAQHRMEVLMAMFLQFVSIDFDQTRP